MDHSTDQTESSSTPLASANAVDQEATTDNTVLIRSMDLDVFNAAKEGKTDVRRTRHERQHLKQILTPTSNTVLHVYIAYASTPKLVKPEEEAPTKPTSFVEVILQVCPTLLWQQNESGETALHMAAKHGCADIVELLIRTAKARRCEDLEQGTAAFPLSSSSEEEAAYWKIYIRTLSKEKDTALHEAVRFKHLDVVEILIREDPDFSYPPNVAGETPLYLAAERRYKALFSGILGTCKHPTYQGPIGRTALHAAVIHGDDEEMTKEILNKKKGLAIAADEKGWTPLHYAAFYDRASIVKQLLEADKCSAYMRDEADKKTALHIAASKGHVRVMKQLISYCPDCCEVVDQRRRNALHYALEKRQSRIIYIIMMDTWLSNVLLNAKDVDGNTPLHLVNAPLCTETPFIVYDKVDKIAFNKENMNALDVIEAKDSSTYKRYLAKELKRNGASSGHRILRENDHDGQKLKENKGGEDKGGEDKGIKESHLSGEDTKGIKESHLIVATLVATVTFAAGVTMPGGYYPASDQGNGTSNVSRQNVTAPAPAPSNGPTPGYAVLTKNTAFRLFYFFDMLALGFSTLSVFMHLLTLTRPEAERFKYLWRSIIQITMFSVAFMMGAFIAGTYAVLGDDPSLGQFGLGLLVDLIILAVYAKVFLVQPENIFKLRYYLNRLSAKIKSRRHID